MIWQIKWVDSQLCHGWHPREHFKPQPLPICTTVGQIVAETKDSIFLAPTFNAHEVCDVMQIPLVCIVERTVCNTNKEK